MMLKPILTATLVCGACASTSDGLVSEVSQNGISENGISQNGISLNGISQNGTSLNGATIAGVSVNGTSSHGAAIMANPSGLPLSGWNLIGSTWTGTTSSGASVALRIDSATAGNAPNTDLWFYGMSYQSSTGWTPLCGLDT